MIDRRHFFKLSTGAALTAAAGLGTRSPLFANLAADRALERIGVQLYTVRDLMEKDVEGTLKAVAAAGYDEVEFAGYFGREPAEIREILDQVGMTAPAAHLQQEAFENQLDEVIAAARIVGHESLVLPWWPEPARTTKGYQALAALANRVGKACQEAGLRFGYHNHDFEFDTIDGKVAFDILLAETDPDLVDLELDLFWIRKGGADPLAYFENHPGRFTLCHVKDMSAEGTMVDVGAGTIDFASIFAHAEQAGLRHYFVEHDQPGDSLASIRASYDHLAALRF